MCAELAYLGAPASRWPLLPSGQGSFKSLSAALKEDAKKRGPDAWGTKFLAWEMSANGPPHILCAQPVPTVHRKAAERHPGPTLEMNSAFKGTGRRPEEAALASGEEGGCPVDAEALTTSRAPSPLPK